MRGDDASAAGAQGGDLWNGVGAQRDREGTRSVNRRTVLRWTASTAAAGAVVGLSSCGAAATSAFNPATADWLASLASSVAATQIENALDGGLKGLWHAWSAHTTKTVDTASPKTFYYDAWAHPAPPAILFSVSDTRQLDPMNDRLLACVNGGREAVRFEPWAWQGLSMYLHRITTDKDGDELAAFQSLCLLTLIPAGTQPDRGSSPEGTVDWMTYKARNGTVEITKVAEPDGTLTAHVTASGILDATRTPRKMKFKLPTQAAT